MIACIVIAGGARTQLLDDVVLPSVIPQEFTEVVVVGEHHAHADYRYVAVPALAYSTLDALVKRDVGALVTKSDALIYLSDDHRLGADFRAQLMKLLAHKWDVLVPHRYVWRGDEKVRLNNGERDGYCGGHCGVFRRALVLQRPWTAGPHHREWDRLMSECQQDAGAVFVATPLLEVFDIEPGATPWL